MESTSPPKKRWYAQLSTGSGIALASLILSAVLTYSQRLSDSHDARLRNGQRYVEMALGILSEKAPRDTGETVSEFKGGERALREWAIDALNESSPAAFKDITGDARESLVSGRTDIPGWGKWGGGSSAYRVGKVEGYYGEDSWDGKSEPPEKTGREQLPPQSVPLPKNR